MISFDMIFSNCDFNLPLEKKFKGDCCGSHKNMTKEEWLIALASFKSSNKTIVVIPPVKIRNLSRQQQFQIKKILKKFKYLIR